MKALNIRGYCQLAIIPLFTLLPFFALGQTEAGLYDMSGNRLFHLVDNGKQHAVDENGRKTMPDPDPKKNVYYREADLISSNGSTYYYDYGWDQIVHNNKVLIEYNFNRRRYEWVEDQNVEPKGRTSSKDAARIYLIDDGYKSPEHGDIALLTYNQGIYYDEFGNPTYQLVGGFPAWANIILFHDFYQRHYTGSALDSVLTIRKPYRDSLDAAFALQNSIAEEMLNLGDKYKNTVALTSNYKVIYFSKLNDQATLIEEDKIKKVPNKWLILNEDTFRNITPHEMPEGGHFTKKKDAKAMGIPLPKGPLIIWEIKIKPEYTEEFNAMISQ